MLKLLFAIAVVLVVASEATLNTCLPSITKAWGTNKTPLKGFCKGDQIFIDEFDSFDRGIWTHEFVNYNGEFQLYVDSDENAYTSDGTLKIRPTLNFNDPENPIRSSRLISQNSFAFSYGTAEIRAKIPLGSWLWPAIWMMPRDSVYGQWPASGEIDIMESRGNAEWINSVSSTLHWGPNSAENHFYLTTWGKTQANSFHDDFHNYQVEWTPDHIKFSVDNEETGSVYPPGGGFWELGGFGGDNIWGGGARMAPFDQPFFFILNVAVGGTSGFFADHEGGKPWNDGDWNAKQEFWDARDSWLGSWNIDTEQAALVVDYVRVNAL